MIEKTLTPDRIAFLTEDFSQGFIAALGLKAVRFEPGLAESRLELGPDHKQQDGFVHAGVAATAADHTAGYALFTVLPEDQRVLTIEFKINLLRPAHGSALVCRAKVLRLGRRVAVGESEVYDVRPEGEVLAAKATVTGAVTPAADLMRGKYGRL